MRLVSFAINIIWVIAAGGRKGLNTGSSVVDGGSNLNLQPYKEISNCFI